MSHVGDGAPGWEKRPARAAPSPIHGGTPMLIDKKDGILDFVSIGRKNIKVVHRNLPTAVLYEHVVRNREGQI